MHRIRALLKRAGKGDRKVAAVFGISPEHCDRAVRHLHRGAPNIPVWLYSTREPFPETAALCDKVVVRGGSLALLAAAEKQLWPFWVALSVGTWTGERGCWPLKLAPFLIPPFRALLLNRNGDFFAAAPGAIARHVRRLARDAVHSGWHRGKDVAWGVWLWLFALAAQRASWLSRRAFAGREGSAALPAGVPESPAPGIAVYRYRHRRWDWAEVDRLVRESTCGRILFLEAGAEDELPWIDDPTTFAVSRQVGFRGWKPCLFPIAPFRHLQPGEVSRTLAPVSTAMLVDRAKLAALGVPKTVVPGSAWLILFWKAAAAGWRSYSVGGSRKLREMPDWPYEEAEFVTRFLDDGALRSLVPREPDLAGGSIARPLIPGPRGSGGRPRVLLLSPYLPWPLSHGGAVRIYSLCKALADCVDFTLACFREKADTADYAGLHAVFREVYVVDRDERAVQNPALPAQVREHVSRSMRALIADLAPRADLLQVEFTHMAGFRDAAPRLPAILVEHDLTFTLYRQLAERDGTAGAREEYERWLAFERRWLAAYDTVWTMSDEDRETALREGAPPERTAVVPNGVDLERFAPDGDPAWPPEVLYVGSFRHLPNILGFEKLRHDIMPAVWRRFPEARLRVVAGPEPERYWREFMKTGYPVRMDSRIAMHAFVADVRPLYAAASVVAVPLLVSAGTNIKVMEAMACRKAVVTTPVGCGGLGLQDGGDALIRSGPDEFAEAVCGLLADAALRGRIAEEARRTVESRFNWQDIARHAYAGYEALLGAGKSIAG